MTKLVTTLLAGLVLSLGGWAWYLSVKIRRVQAALDLEKRAGIRLAHIHERQKVKGLSNDELAKRAGSVLDSVRRSVESMPRPGADGDAGAND